MAPVSIADPQFTLPASTAGGRAAGEGLADCLIELLSFVQAFRQTAGLRQPSYESVRGEILRLLKQSEAFPAGGRCTWEEYDQVRYAVCAWIDETVMAAAWDHAGRWRPEPLQRIYYNATDAGDKFFERLRGLSGPQNAVREVYYLCLVLGFEGRYCGPGGGATLHQLTSQQLSLLFDGWTEMPTVKAMERERLFPNALAQGPASAPPRPDLGRNLFVSRMILAGSTFLFAVLYLVYRLSLHSLGTNILRAVGKA